MPRANPCCFNGKTAKDMTLLFANRAAPPKPWTTRMRIRRYIFGANPQRADAIVKSAKPETKTDLLPKMSENRPAAGSARATEIKNTEITHCDVLTFTSKDLVMLGRAKLVMVESTPTSSMLS